MTIKTIEVAGMAAALTALRLPFGKEERSEIKTQNGYFVHPDGNPLANPSFASSCEIIL